MGVIKQSKRLSDIERDSDEVFIYEPLENSLGICFYCGDPYSYPLIYWRGWPSEYIFMHQKCAKDFGCALIGDSASATQR